MKALFQPLAVCSAIACLAASPALAGNDCRYDEPREATVEAKGAKSVRIIAKAGTLRIEGRSGLEEVRVRGTACASKERLLDDVRLEAERSGDVVRVEAIIPDNRSFWRSSSRLDLTIEVPDSVALRVRDSSGSTDIRGVGELSLKDSSGSIFIEDVAGNIEVDDSSGEIEIVGAERDVRVEDSSGEIDIREVGGSVDIVQDSSGEIDISKVEGSVLVRRDSSGSIYVRDVGGDFTVERDGSGSIRYRDVKGRVDIPKKKRAR